MNLGVRVAFRLRVGHWKPPGAWGKDTGWGGEVGSFWRGNHGLRRLRKETTCREELLERSRSDPCQCWSHVGEFHAKPKHAGAKSPLVHAVLMCTCVSVCSLHPLAKVLEFCCWE